MKLFPLSALAASGLILAGCTPPTPFAVTSGDVKDGRFTHAQMFNAYGCTGDNLSPSIEWEGAPSNAQSFAVVIFDPDAKPKGWYHWLVVDIPATERSLASGAGKTLPLGMVQTKNDFGVAAYGGPCPPPGEDHRYVTTVYALNVTSLHVDPAAAPADIVAKIKASEIAESKLTVKAKR